MLTATRRPLILLVLILTGLTALLLSDGHSPLSAITLAFAYAATALTVGLGAALLLDATTRKANWRNA